MHTLARLLALTLACSLTAPAWALPPKGQVSTFWKLAHEPIAVSSDAQGTLYVIESDMSNRFRIVKRTPDGRTTVLADERQFPYPDDLVVDAQGNVFVSDRELHAIRRISPDGTITTLAGGTRGYQDGVAAQARFRYPEGLALDAQGNLYVADSDNHRIRKVSPDGTVTTVAGAEFKVGVPHQDGPPDKARFYYPRDLVVSPDGTIFVVDSGNNCIRRISRDGTVSTWAGKPGTGRKTFGNADGKAEARFRLPMGIAQDAAGTLYVADFSNHRIRRIAADGTVVTLAGSRMGKADGPLREARFRFPESVTTTPQGGVVVADSENRRLCRIEVN